jgi:hypothetical protein
MYSCLIMPYLSPSLKVYCIKSTVNRSGFKSPGDDTKDAYKMFSWYLVKVPLRYVNL